VDLGSLGALGSHITWDVQFFTGILSIVLIDLVLAGDNAVVIAMAVRMLPKRQRFKGIFFGAGAAVILRVVFTFFVSQLLQIKFLKLGGGALILWIAVKLLVEGGGDETSDKEAKNIWQAIKLIIIADITMSTDNVLAVAGASHGNLFLLVFGLALSIPFVIFTSSLLSMLMDKFPIIILLGAAVLGRVGGEMMITDSWVVNLLQGINDGLVRTVVSHGKSELLPVPILKYSVEIFFTVGVVLVGKYLVKRKTAKEQKKEKTV
jgi:YjbE family integral membrane protein